MSSSRIDVSIEHRDTPEPQAKKHPNTCPRCDSHYRDDELDKTLWVCRQCGHHFPMRARARIASLVDEGKYERLVPITAEPHCRPVTHEKVSVAPGISTEVAGG